MSRIFSKAEDAAPADAPATGRPEGESTGAVEPDAAKPAGVGADIANMIGNHKGKLAMGAAAMLGVAIFYKWREGRLAKEDPEEYARLQRLKAAVGKDAEADGDNNETGSRQ
ncbi:MAG TPA: hypothetical protein VIM12_18335 [Noviherbaspirillum sp.]|jgi:hypothetical protein|uniref:hypothetical protein n=1 Tax=Noviherbaspirillum sp. TaxID=1926288 RepID=UPI002F93D78B